MLQIPWMIISIMQLLPQFLGWSIPTSVILLTVYCQFCVAVPNYSDPEPEVVLVDEDRDPVERVHEALQCLLQYDLSVRWTTEENPPFLYWKIRDFAHAYRSGITTPSAVSGSLDRMLLTCPPTS